MPLVPVKAFVAAGNVSSVKCDGEDIKGIQSIDYKIVKKRTNVHAIGLHERYGIDYGEMFVQGIIRVKSAYPKFDENMAVEKTFQLVAELKDQKEVVGKITFDECFIESRSFTMDVNSSGVSEYAFSSTRLREELGGSSIDFGKQPGGKEG